MRHEIAYRPTFAQLRAELQPGEAILAESGAMLSHSQGIEVETGMRGGLVQSLKRSVFGGESFFLNRFVAREPGSVTFAPRLPGDLVQRELGHEPLFVQSSSFLAGSPEVELDTKFGGFRTFFAGEGLFLLRLTGPGEAFLSSFGAIDEVRLPPGERFTVDTGHVVAFESSIPYSVRRVGGLASTVLSGEGLVVEFEGPGTVWTQSRSPDAFLSWIASNVSPGGGAVVPVDYSSEPASDDASSGGPFAAGAAGSSGGNAAQNAGQSPKPRRARSGGRRGGTGSRRGTGSRGGRGKTGSGGKRGGSRSGRTGKTGSGRAGTGNGGRSRAGTREGGSRGPTGRSGGRSGTKNR